ncbi:hypothetical protein H9P43_009225 [Blastocladiella emersonii ATCC 22665]|nr:hypothetical protein H9P43_009225 [Blastocladiella emersonii ATCC 22665]
MSSSNPTTEPAAAALPVPDSTSAAPAPAATSETATSATETTASRAAAPPTAAKSADLVRDKDVKHQCCGCMEIRRGVTALLIIDIVLNILSAMMMLAAVSMAKFALAAAKKQGRTIAGNEPDAEAALEAAYPLLYVAAALAAVGAAFAIWGLVSVRGRKVRNFKIFATINVLLVIVDAIMLPFNLSSGSVIVVVAKGYFAYVFFSYVDTMRAEKEAIKELELKAASSA